MRRITLQDIPAVVAISTDPRTHQHSPSGPPSVEESEAMARQFIEDWRRDGIGYWVIEHDGQIVGIAGVKDVRLIGQPYWNLYFRFSPLVWGQGLAREAALAAVEVTRQHGPDRAVIARTRPGNAAAIRLASAIGMRRAPDLDSRGFITYLITAAEQHLTCLNRRLPG